MTRLPRLAFCAAIATTGGLAAASDPPADARAVPSVRAVAAVRIEEPPEIDGRLDDAVWQQAAVLDQFQQVEPIEGAEPSERTEVRLLVDADHLYVGIRCFDRDPAGIIGTTMQRDRSLGADDHVTIVVDTFLDHRNGFLFEMNSIGAKRDGLVEDNQNLRDEWDGIWYGKSSIDELGWTVEMALPFKTLSFDPGGKTWGFNVERYLRRRNELIRWAAVTQNKSIRSIGDAGQIEGLRDLRQGLGIDFKPYGVFTGVHDRERNDDSAEIDAGFDLFYKFTPSLTLAVTVNTDFAETEVDERQVNLTRFPLFFPEKRDFFLQDAGIFSFGGIRRNPLPFFSRRIGIGPGGETIDIRAGVKLTGRAGPWNIGLLDVQMDEGAGVDEKNLAVGRVSYNVLEESTIGAIVTYGDPRTDGDNGLAGVDFNFRDSNVFDGRILEAHAFLLGSRTDPAGDGEEDALAFGGRIEYPNDIVDWSVGFTQIDDEFNAALGFVPRRGIREYFGNYRYRWRPEGFIRTVDVGVFGLLVTDLDDELESSRVSIDVLRLGTDPGDEFELSYIILEERLTRDFEISDGVIIPPGEYPFERIAVEAESSSGRPVSVFGRVEWGEFFSGNRTDLAGGIEWRASPHLFLGGEMEINDINLDEGDFITRLLRLRANVYFTPDLSWTTFAQYDNVSKNFGVNSRVRWIIEPGNELFVVVNQGYLVEDGHVRSTFTQLTTKVGWTFRF